MKYNYLCPDLLEWGQLLTPLHMDHLPTVSISILQIDHHTCRILSLQVSYPPANLDANWGVGHLACIFPPPCLCPCYFLLPGISVPLYLCSDYQNPTHVRPRSKLSPLVSLLLPHMEVISSSRGLQSFACALLGHSLLGNNHSHENKKNHHNSS